jgi:hypothetical protein
LSGHLWSATILAAAATLALAADRLAADRRPGARPASGGADVQEIGSFATPLGVEPVLPRFVENLHYDPLEDRAVRPATGSPIASPRGNPTVSGSAGARRLTAILVADDKPVAVVDDQVVAVGASLKDGARISAIRDNKVFLVEKDGKWRVLTLATGAGRP